MIRLSSPLGFPPTRIWSISGFKFITPKMKFFRIFLLWIFLASFGCAAGNGVIDRFSSQPNDWFANFEFRARTVGQPSDVESVIVLLSRDWMNLDGELLAPKWQRLADQKKIGIVALGYAFQDKLPKDAKPGSKPLYQSNPDRARDLLHRELKQQILARFPHATKYGYVTRDDSASMATGILVDSPKDTLFWVIEDRLWGVPGNLRNLPPGLVINRNRGATGRMLEVQRQNRLERRNITFVRDNSESRTALDEFTMNFICAVVSGVPVRPAVADIETEEPYPYGAPVPREKVANTVWLPDTTLLQSWQALHSLQAKEQLADVLKESVPTGVPGQPELNLYLKMPSKLSKGQAPKGVFCIAGWMVQEPSMIHLIRYGTFGKGLLDWADANGMAVITWNTHIRNSATLWRTGIGQEELERDAARYFDKNFDAMANAWDQGIRRMVTKYALPENGYFLYGISGGAHWAHRLVLRRPQRFSAVHFHIANSYDIPDAKAKNVLWLVTTGELDSGYQASFEFYRKCRELDFPIMAKAGAGLSHNDREDIEKLSLAFFDYANGLRTAASSDSRFLSNTAFDPATRMRQDLSRSVVFGDFINQGVYEASQGSWVPVAQRVPLVTGKIAEAWGKKEGY
jgi:hypothetical protein